MPATVSTGQPCYAIIWKFSARFAGIPDGCNQDLGKPGLNNFHVIASQIFTDFVRTAGISFEKLNPLNRASPSHVIGA